MEIRPSLMLPAMLKALSETVLPAVDPENKLAVEQTRLVIGMLQFMSNRLPLLARYDGVELRDYRELAERLLAVTSGGPITVRAKREMELALGDRSVDDVEARLLKLRERVSGLVVAVHEDGDASTRATVRRLVIEASRAETDRARAWVLPQGWEAPGSVPPIESLLAEKRGRE